MKEINEKLEKFKKESGTKSSRNDLSTCKMIFSEESSRAINEMGNMELIELKQTSATFQWTMERIRVAFAALKTPYYRAPVIISRGKKSGHNPWQQDHQKTMNAKRGVLKRCKFASILDRWQNDEVYRASQLVHGWTDEWVKCFDCISKTDIGHGALYRQRLRYESTIYLRSVDSNTQAGPLCQRPYCISSANALVSLQRAQGKGVHHIPISLRTRQNNTLDPAVQQHLEWLSFNWKTSRHLHPRHGQKAQRGGVLHLATTNGKNGTLKGGKTKNGGISDNNDNARVKHRPVQGDLYGELRAKRSQLLSSSPESGLHLMSCALLRFRVLSGIFASRQWQLPWTRRRVYRPTPHRTHTRALFFSPRTLAHARCVAFWFKAWRFVHVPQKSFHHWSYLFWIFLRVRFLLFSHSSLPHWRHLLPHRRHWLESD